MPIDVFVVVCESGPSEMNRWMDESRNVAADYERAFKKPAPPIKLLRLQINTQHTSSDAKSWFGEVASVARRNRLRQPQGLSGLFVPVWRR